MLGPGGDLAAPKGTGYAKGNQASPRDGEEMCLFLTEEDQKVNV